MSHFLLWPVLITLKWDVYMLVLACTSYYSYLFGLNAVVRYLHIAGLHTMHSCPGKGMMRINLMFEEHPGKWMMPVRTFLHN